MKTNEIMTPNPRFLSPDDTLISAAAQMKDLNIGMLPVCNHNRLVGVLTDRDIAIRAVANGLDPYHVAVRSVMSRLIVSCFEDQDQEVAASIMETNRIRRLPVLDRNEHLVGIISLGDLAVRTNDEGLARRVLEHVSPDPEDFERIARLS